MKRRNIIGIIIIAVLMAYMVMSFTKETTSYADFQTARLTGKSYHIIGQWVNRENASYDSEKDLFVFDFKDEKGEIHSVYYYDPKPVGFEQSQKIVVSGKFQNERFVADKILMKCPSKYTDDKLDANL